MTIITIIIGILGIFVAGITLIATIIINSTISDIFSQNGKEQFCFVTVISSSISLTMGLVFLSGSKLLSFKKENKQLAYTDN